MLKIFLFILVIWNSIDAAQVVKVEEKYQSSESCKSCHIHIVKEWESSWHAKSHYENDEYFRQSIDYVSRKTRKSLNSVKIQCATCHNPRISVTKTDMDYEIMSVMDLDKGSKVNEALKSSAIDEGINCVVCHNIDKIHADKDESLRGINRVSWTKSGTMTGPYDDSASPYHKVEHRDFMDKNSDQLCFVCHANDRADDGFVFTNMKNEYKNSENSCVDCHMGLKKLSYAANLPIDKGKPKKREIRAHGFVGAHTPDIWKDVLNLKLSQKGKNIVINILNPQPHNIPSGFGSRELIVELRYKNADNSTQTKAISLTNLYTNKRGKPTIPHLAVKSSGDMSIPAYGEKILQVLKEDGATSVEVTLYYRLVNDEVRSILNLKDEIWSKKSFITSKNLNLK